MSLRIRNELSNSLNSDQIIIDKIMEKVGVDTWDSDCQLIFQNGDYEILSASLTEMANSKKYEFYDVLNWGESAFLIERKN